MSESTSNARRVYWKSNLRLLAILLAVWFAVSFGAGILFVDALDSVRIGGFKLGFWFSQQGSIYVFVILVVIYVRKMNALDKRLSDERRKGETGSTSELSLAPSGADSTDDDAGAA